MTVAHTAPGVYVTEIASGARAIAGVSTSLTAFVGPALRGPVDDPTPVASWPEFERRFGGLWVRSTMSQSVRHYFSNGGSRALIVRTVNGDEAVLAATDAAEALAGFAALRVEVGGVTATTFDLTLAAVDGAGAVLDDGTDPHEVSLAGVAPGGLGAALAGATAPTGVALATLVGDEGLTDPPPEGTWESTDPGGGHVVTIGSRATAASATIGVGLVLEATDAVAATAAFDHLHVTVTNSDASAGTFDLEVAARASDDSPVEVGGTQLTASAAGLNVADADALASTVAGLSAASVALATVRGRIPSAPPADGTSTSSEVDGRQRVTLAVEQVTFGAASPGAWGDRLRVSVDTVDAEPGAFHLAVREVDEAGATVEAETHLNVSTAPDASGALERVLELRSVLVRLLGHDAAEDADASAGETALSGGADGAAPRIAQDIQGLGTTTPRGLQALALADLFNLLCIPLERWSTTDTAVGDLWDEAVRICEERRAFLLVDPPEEWDTDPQAAVADAGGSTLTRSANAALYYPRVRAPDPLRQSRLATFPPCGVVAGVFARTDAERGVWKAPAGTAASLLGVPELATGLTDGVHGDLNSLGVSCLRSLAPYGRVVWGARTLEGADLQASEWKYVPVRRTALYLEESILRGTYWAVFEPNGETLWSQLRLAIGSFLHRLYRQGAFAGASPREAYLVKCDAETTTAADIDRGVVNVLIGFAPLRPAEFVIISLQQLAGQAGQ